MRITTLEMSEMDFRKAAEFAFAARQRSALRREDRTLEGIREQFEEERAKHNRVVIEAYDETKLELVGLMVVFIEWPEFGVIQPWQPIVHPDKNPEQTAISLMQHSKTLVNTHSKSRIEVWLPIDSDGAKRYRLSHVS